MHRALVISLVAAAAVSACPAPPEVYGPFTQQDVGDITAVVMQRSDILKPILRIDDDGRDKARLTTGRDDTAGARFNEFKMAKRDGRWTIISPIEEEKILVTSADAHRLH